MPASTRWPVIVFAGDAPRETLSRAAAAGRLRRLARGIYTPSHEPADRLICREWRRIVALRDPNEAEDYGIRLTLP